MSDIQYKVIARRFIEEISNTGMTEATPDIIYREIAEEIRGLEDFKKWVG